MTETTTPTDEVVDQSSSDIRDESLLDSSNEQDSAVEQPNDTDSSESNDSDSDSSSTEGDSSDEDKGLSKFAKSQGFEDPDNLSDDAKRALRLMRKQVQSDRKKMEEEANKRKLNDEVKDLTSPDENDDANEVLAKRMARFEAKEMANEFWANNPEDKKYESKMASLLNEEKTKYGAEAAWRLAQNLPRLLREAKFADGAFDSDAARDAGRREERERLRKSQEGSADTAHATTASTQSAKKIDREWVENDYDPSNEEHRKLLDKAIERGDLY